MSEPLDELYFKWLYGQACSVRAQNPSRTYWKLLRLLFTKEFIWLVPNDDNRVVDGIELRYEFLEENGYDEVDPDWLNLGCSMLEMILGLARRLSFEDDGEAKFWFWELMENLELDQYADSKTIPKDVVDDILDRVIWRNYKPDGTGGLFPLKNAEQDQRHIELWYQLSAYLLERE